MRRNFGRLLYAVSIAGVLSIAVLCVFSMFTIAGFADESPILGTVLFFSYAGVFSFICWLTSHIFEPESLKEAFE